ncbi:hypothetical protein LTR66_002073 [Elasticomyces elasticus]|nr:hypothetical protein LTR66_002073 [Elasticomyces elasticus]
MITELEKWAATTGLLESSPLEQLSGRTVAIEAEHFIDRILTNPSTREPLLPALGGLPFALESNVHSQITVLGSYGITPLFMFSGLSPQTQNSTSRSIENSVKAIRNAWELYSGILHKYNIDFRVAPYSAVAQLASIDGTAYCDAICGSTELLLFDVEKIITKFDFENSSFSWMTRSSCVDALGLGSTSAFVDACLLSGSSFLPTLPQLTNVLASPLKQPMIKAATELLRRHGLSGNAVCMHYQDLPQNNEANSSYLERYQKARLAVRHHIVIQPDGTVEPLDKANAPGDLHALMGQQMPPEIIDYLSRGVIGPHVLNWRASGAVYETVPLDCDDSDAYHALVRDKLVPLRASALSLLSQSLNRYYQHRDVTLHCWFDSDDSGKQLGILDLPDPKPIIAGWNVKIDAIEKKATQLKLEISKLTFTIKSLEDTDFAKSTRITRGKKDSPLQTNQEILCNTVWRFLGLCGYIQSDHTLSQWGRCLSAALGHLDNAYELEEPVFLAMELLRLDMLNADYMFPTPPYHGQPMRGTETDRRNTLLVSRVAALGNLRHNSIGYTGPLSRHLAAYHSIIFAVRSALRDLAEMSLCTLLVRGDGSRKKSNGEWIELGLGLPLLRDNDCGLGIAVKSYLDEIVHQSSPTELETRNSIKEKGAREWFPHVPDFSGDLDRAFILWDAVYAGVKAADGSLISQNVKNLWGEVVSLRPSHQKHYHVIDYILHTKSIEPVEMTAWENTSFFQYDLRRTCRQSSSSTSFNYSAVCVYHPMPEGYTKFIGSATGIVSTKMMVPELQRFRELCTRSQTGSDDHFANSSHVEDSQHHLAPCPPPHHLFSNRQKQPIAHVAQPRLDHAPIIRLLIHTTNPHLDTLAPLFRRAPQTLLARDYGAEDDALDAPVAQGGYAGAGGRARGDHGVDEDGEVGG